MDSNRFDNWARTRAQKLSRRKAVGVAGAAGLAAVTSRVLPASAQGYGPTCQMSIQALTSAGPSLDVAYAGVLEITLGLDGAIDQGSFIPDGGVSVPVVGESEGRALSLRVTLADGQALVLTGTGQQDIDTCSGALSGVFGGPELGDTGSWLIDPGLSITLDPGNGGSGSGTGTVIPTITPTPTQGCPGVECGTYSVVDPESCECICPAPYEFCGPACCPGGSECIDESTGECACAYGAEQCRDSCVESCEPGYQLDYDTCECVEGCEPIPCPQGEIFSDVSCGCESYCNTNSQTPYYCEGNCYAEPWYECNGQCYSHSDLDSNADMCGASCEVCPDGVSCIGGSCDCPAGATYCQGSGCKDLYDDNDNCGDCGNVCPVGTSCQGGSCELYQP